MLKTILTSGQDIDMINEMFMLCPRWLHPDLQNCIHENIGSVLSDNDVDALVELLYSGKPYGYFWTEIGGKIDREKLRGALLGSELSLRGIFQCLLEQHADAAGKLIPGAKFPLHYSRAETLLEWFPDCKLIHTVRDPRAVYSSQMNKYVSEEFSSISNAWIRFKHFSHIFIQIKWSTKIHKKLKDHPNYFLSKYEDLVQRPDVAVSRLCEFLGVDQTPEMLNPTQYNSSFKQNVISHGFDKRATDSWRDKLSVKTVALINTLNHKELSTLGYSE